MTLSKLNVGDQASSTVLIDAARTIDFLGAQLRIYATPELVRDIELTCLNFLVPYLAPGEASVGTDVQIKHSGATLLGMQVNITVTVTHIDRRSIGFSVLASDGVEEICRGSHARFVLDVEKLRGRAAGKAEQVRLMAAGA
ncbi:MAG TPA: LysR family transcriptional regulator [Telluria sp.]|nr:LysR family transcriptional regulator [Telluria sp.]